MGFWHGGKGIVCRKDLNFWRPQGKLMWTKFCPQKTHQLTFKPLGPQTVPMFADRIINWSAIIRARVYLFQRPDCAYERRSGHRHTQTESL